MNGFLKLPNYKNNRKNWFSELDAGVNLPGLGCVEALNRLVNGLDISPFTYTIQTYAAPIHLYLESRYLDNSYYKHKINIHNFNPFGIKEVCSHKSALLAETLSSAVI